MFNLFSVDILIYKKISFSYLTNRTGSLILHTPEIPAAILFDRTGIYGHCSGRFIPVPETGPGQNRMLTLCQERGIRQAHYSEIERSNMTRLVPMDDRAVAGF